MTFEFRYFLVMKLSFLSFFCLKNFSHKELMVERDHLWAVFDDIGVYCNDFFPKLTIRENRILGNVDSKVHFENEDIIFLGKGSKVSSFAYIEGPCIIGKNCDIRPGAYIRKNVIIGDNCIVGHGVEIKNSIVLNGAKIAHFSYIGDSIIGNDVMVGAGVKCSNVRFDKKDVVVVDAVGDRENSGRKKLGSIIGDGVCCGCNSVMNPGTIIGKKSVVWPSINVGGFIPSGCRIKLSNAITKG